MKRMIVFSISLFFVATVIAQSDSAKILDEVVVTAAKAPVKQSETGKVVNIITRAELDKSFGKSLSEVLNQLPGIMINGADNTLGTNQTIYTRGASSSNTLILLDGMPLFDASGIGNEFDLNNFSLDNVERIEVLKGSQSTLYGSDAVAGVINLISKKGEKKPFNVNVNLSAGSYDSYKGAVSLNGFNGKGQTYFLSYNKIISKGFSSAYDSTGKGNFDRDGFDQDLFQLNYTVKPFAKTRVRVFGKYSNNHSDIDAGPFADDKDHVLKNNNTVLGTSVDYHLNNGFIRFQYNYNQYKRNLLDDSSDIGGFSTFQKGTYKGTSHFAEIFTNLKLASNIELLAGIDYRSNFTDQLYMYLPDFGAPATPITGESEQYSGYASLNVKTVKGFNMELGSRWNHHSIYGTNYTSSINPFYLINNKYKIYASISSGYRVPSLYQLYSEYGNTDLKPENTLSYEAGVQYFNEKVKASITGFKRDGKDVFLFYTDPVTYAGKYLNGDKQNDYGIEAEAAFQLNKKISASLNYTFVDGKITTQNNGKDSSYFNLYKRPKNTLNLRVNYQPVQDLTMTVSLRAVGKSFEPVYMSKPYELKGYYTVGFYAGYSFNKTVSLFADLQNISDQEYFVTRGYNSKGFNVYGGVKLAF